MKFSNLVRFLSIILIINIHVINALNIVVSSPGQLSRLLSKTEKKTIDTLVLTGQLDARDIKCLRDEVVNLSYLNMENATIVEYSEVQGVSVVKKYPANEMPEYSFYNGDIQNKQLKEVFLPVSITSIGVFAFYSCINLSKVVIYKNVNTIYNNSFLNCYGLSEFIVDPDNDSFCTDEGVLYNRNKTLLIQCPANKRNVFVVPPTVNTISNTAFFACKNIPEIIIPTSVKRIGYKWFVKCSGLKRIIIPESINDIGAYAFFRCTGLENVTLPSTIKNIGGFTFCGCEKLKSIDLPNSLKTIGDYAFSDCEQLSGELLIPSSVVSIGEGVFSDCINLNNIIVPNSVKIIGNGAFASCAGLKGNFKIPESVSTIGNYVFRRCSNLESVTLPESIKSIGNYAFSECVNLSAINIPENLNSIGIGAFEFCRNLQTIYFSEKLSKIGSKAFFGCGKLSSIYSNMPVPVNLDKSELTFWGVDLVHCTLYVPTGSKTSYINSNQWNDFVSIIEK